MHWNLKERKCVAPEKKDEKVLEGISILFVFFVHYCYGGKEESKSRGEEK